MGRIGTAVLAFLLISPAAQAQHTICDATCEPDPASSTYAPTIAARPGPSNARGLSSSIAPQITVRSPIGGSGAGLSGSGPVLAGSESYSYAVPILRLPGRNGLDLNLTLYYNSRVWTIDSTSSTATFNADRDFPSYGFRLGFGYLEYDSTNDAYILTEADGTKRHLHSSSTSSYDSDDTSYINFNSSSLVLTYKNGTQVTYQGFPSSTTTLFRPIKITDTNGNYISISYVSHVANKADDQRISAITDTLGRGITFTYDANDLLTSISQGSKTYATFSWNTGYVLNYSFTGLTVDANSPASGSTQKVLTGCTYANSTSYSFLYGDWGIVKEIDRKSSNGTLRSSVSYNYPAYTTAPSSAPTWTIETDNDGFNTVSSTYSSTKVGGLVSIYTVTDPGGSKTVAALNTSGTYQEMLSSMEIRDDGSNPLRHVDYVWTSDTGGWNARPSSVTTTLSDSGQQSKVAYTYTTYGNVSLTQEYDYGLVLKRQTALTYLTTSSYINHHILDRVTQVLVKDGAGNIVGRTNLAYDAGSPMFLSPAPVQNSGSAYRGNVTSITRYANAAAGTGPITRNFTYDTAGNLRTADLDCCNQKQWNYSSTTQYAYPDSVVRGPVGTQLSTSATYNFASGTVATATDENGKITSFTYDNMDRLATATLPNGVVVTASNNDSGQWAAVSRSSTANSAVQATTVDGRGRTTQQQLLNGASSVSTVTASYYDVGRQRSVSNPTGPSDPLLSTVTQLDYLGRAVSVAPPSGGSYTYTYSGNTVTVSDPAGKQRRNTTDALGRLVKVEEPGWGDGLPGKGSVTITGSEQTTQGLICDNADPPNCHMGIVDYDTGTVSITVNGVTKSVSY
jgi:YD repeat-containing protein